MQNAVFCMIGKCFKTIMDHLQELESWPIYVNLLATKSGKRETVFLTSGPINSTITRKNTTFSL